MIFEAIALYFVIGVVALALLDLITGRVRKRLREASYETQDKLIKSGQAVGVKTALLLTIGALLLFWWLAIYSAIRDVFHRTDNSPSGR